MTAGLRDLIATHMHGALTALRLAPNAEAFDALANIFNMMSLVLRDDARHSHEALLITGGAKTMNQIGSKCEAGLALRDHEAASLTVAVSAIDEILPRIDVSRLYLSERLAVAIAISRRSGERS
ncbi:hypothetical protein [Achromobacter pestifer]